MFISVSAVGDYGSNLKGILVVVSSLGALFCILCATVTPDLYWLGGIFMVLYVTPLHCLETQCDLFCLLA